MTKGIQHASRRGRWVLIAALALGAGACGGDDTPPASSNVWPDGGVTRSTAAAHGYIASSAGSTPQGGIASPTDTNTSSADGGAGNCGSLTCSTSQYCLLQGTGDPTVPAAAQCIGIPAGCNACDCLSTASDCICGPGASGFVISCP